MRKISDRAGNMLSVVASNANETVTRNPEDFMARSFERIQSEAKWNGVELADLVRAQLVHFIRLVGSCIYLQGPRLRLNPTSSQAIGLALHEVATNAGRTGALSTGQGRIDISRGTTGGTLTISRADRDGPPVTAPQKRGFGSIVMQALAERSVAGGVDLRYSSQGSPGA
jgi:two-component sensor histidine kinase